VSAFSDSGAPSRIYLSPGMFGFARLASFEYFEHMVRALEQRFHARSRAVEVRVCEAHPTSSIRRRAGKLADLVAATAGTDEGAIHLLGHSTGGLDARLIASPSVCLRASGGPELDWIRRLCSVTTMNTPHYGTPLASFFATVSGQRLLYAVSALTVTALKLGAPPLAATSALVAALGRVELGGFELELVDRTVESVIRVLDEASSRELRAWLKLLRDDQGGIVQLMPEAMDLFHAGIADRPFVRYQCVASYAPETAIIDWIASMGSPWRALSATIFTALYNITARHDDRYPCAAPPDVGERQVRALLGQAPPAAASDGIVPLYSQIWGELVWIGKADHLDTVGHFPGRRDGHTDWLSSGARFNRVRFDLMIDRIVDGLLLSEQVARARRSSQCARDGAAAT
jgi:triacylglycerol lipase